MDTVSLKGILGRVPVRRPFSLSNPALDLTVHSDGERTIIFVSNPTSKEVGADLLFTGARRFRDLWRDEGEKEGRERIPLELAPYTVKIWEVLK